MPSQNTHRHRKHWEKLHNSSWRRFPECFHHTHVREHCLCYFIMNLSGCLEIIHHIFFLFCGNEKSCHRFSFVDNCPSFCHPSIPEISQYHRCVVQFIISHSSSFYYWQPGFFFPSGLCCIKSVSRRLKRCKIWSFAPLAFFVCCPSLIKSTVWILFGKAAGRRTSLSN